MAKTTFELLLANPKSGINIEREGQMNISEENDEK